MGYYLTDPECVETLPDLPLDVYAGIYATLMLDKGLSDDVRILALIKLMDTGEMADSLTRNDPVFWLSLAGNNWLLFCGNDGVMFVDPLGLSAWDWFSNGMAMVAGGVQVAAGAVIIGTTGWTGIGAAAGTVLAINGASSFYAGGHNMVRMATGRDATLNNSGYAGLVTSLVTDNPRANAVASTLDIGANLASGIGGVNAVRTTVTSAGRVGTVSRYMYDVNQLGTLSSANRLLSAEELARQATQASRTADILTVLGVGMTTADTLLNLNRSYNEDCQK